MKNTIVTVAAENPLSADASTLIEELSATLARITGDSGKASFDANDVRGPNACFLVARNLHGKPVGCGALRPLETGVAEIKRMYARPGTSGIGTAVLTHLEAEAYRLGYAVIRLETRRVNERAVTFYLARGYATIANYGKYVGNAKAVCFEKRMRSTPS